MINRDITPYIKKASKKYPIISITGPRQSGKTTLSQLTFNTYSYFNLENPDTRSFAIDDPRGFLSQKNRMIIDEIQHVPELFSYIQTLTDENSKKHFVITGSQNFLISEKISQSLAGRVAIFKLFPLSMSELSKSNTREKNLIEQIFTGFYPRIYAKNLDPASWYDNYIQSYLERDVRQLKAIENLSIFQKFLSLTAGRTGQILNMTSLAHDIGVSVKTIQSWISVLEASFIVFKLPPYYSNFNKRIIRAPKIHFYDSGLVCALLNINSKKELSNHPLIGNIFESFIVSEYVKRAFNTNQRHAFYFFREKNGKEIDLLFEEKGVIALHEIKYGQTFHESFVQNLLYVERLTNKKVKKRVIYGGAASQKRSKYHVVSWKDI